MNILKQLSILVLFQPFLCCCIHAQDREIIFPLEVNNLLHLEEVRDDVSVSLEQLEEYRAKIAKLQNELRTMHEKVVKLQSVDSPEAKAEVEKIVQESVELSTERLQEIANSSFLPFQIKRLNQIYFWAMVNSGSGFVAILEVPKIQQLLDLRKDQQDEIAKAGEGLQTEFEKELLALKLKYRKKLIEQVLDDDQLKKMEDMLGDPPKFRYPSDMVVPF